MAGLLSFAACRLRSPPRRSRGGDARYPDRTGTGDRLLPVASLRNGGCPTRSVFWRRALKVTSTTTLDRDAAFASVRTNADFTREPDGANRVELAALGHSGHRIRLSECPPNRIKPRSRVRSGLLRDANLLR